MAENAPFAAPVLSHHLVPLDGATPITFTVAVGTPIAELAPHHAGPVVCRLNGAWILRQHWQRPVLPGDVIEFHVLPQDKGASRTALTIALIIAAPEIAGAIGSAYGITSATALAAIQAGVVIVGQLLINAIVPIDQPGAGGGGLSASPTYSVALSGNQARPDQPVPVIYGRHFIYPDFAGQPYTEYDAVGDQYYHALLVIGQGKYTLERVMIDDTPLDHFSDVQYALVNPGDAPTLVLGNVVSAPEVTGQPLITGQFVGGYAASGPTLAATAVGIDIICPRGLGLYDSGGTVGSKTISWRVDAREVSDFGVPLEAWATIGTESLTLATVDVVRRSYTYTLAAPARVEVRLVRTDVKDENQKALHDLAWAGLRAYLNEAATLSATATHLEVRIRASEQLSGLSQRRIGAIVQRWLRTWSPADGWGAEEPTRAIAWALADKWTADYGDALADERLDLATLWRYHQTWEARQDRFDFVFDTTLDSVAADQLIAAAGRARVFRRHGIRSVVRDEWDPLPVTMYGSRDIVPGSLSIDYVLATSDTPDGVIVEYFDNRAWDWRTVDCPAPGYTTGTWLQPVTVRIPGITGATQAEREGLKMAAETFYRRKFITLTTELQGLLPAFGSTVVIAPALTGWGLTGDVAAYDYATLTATLSEPPAWTPGGRHYLMLVKSDGTLTQPVEVLPGPAPRDVVLTEDPQLDWVTDAPDRDRTRFHFGVQTTRTLAKVLGIRPAGRDEQGALLVRITAVADDERVHQADEALLPGPGDNQDPVTPEDTAVEEGGTGGGTLQLANLADRSASNAAPSGGNVAGVLLRLRTDGIAELVYTYGSYTETLANQWLLGAPVEAAVAATFEVYATLISGTLATGTVDTWLAVDTAREWSVSAGPSDGVDSAAVVFLQIRDADELVQATGTFTLSASTAEFGA